MFGSLENISKVNQSMVKTIIHQSKIDIVKFDGTNKFGIWRCEVMDDALIVSNLKDSLLFEKKPDDILERIVTR